MDAESTPFLKEGASLPQYKKPPVMEVAFSVQFEPLSEFHTTHLAEFWVTLKDRYPKIEDKPPLQPLPRETFGQQRQRPQPTLTIHTSPTLPRWYYLNETGEEFFQIQRDRFAYNWRQLSPDSEYPRYSQIRGGFRGALSEFSSFLEKHKLGSVTPNQCELVYINKIASHDVWKDQSELSKAFRPWSSDMGEALDGKLEEASCALSFIINKNKSPAGRLYVTIEPGFERSTKSPIFVMKLTARGNILNGKLDEAMTFLDTGHEWIVGGFDALTTKKMHDAWEKENGT